MKLIEAVNEAVSRSDQLKANFEKAIDKVIALHPNDFDGSKDDKAKSRLLSRFDGGNITKAQIEATLVACGVGREGTITARDIAQKILSTANGLDVPGK